MAGTDLIGRYLAELRQSLAGLPERDRLVEEIEAHLEDAAAAHVARGMAPAAATARALHECGAVTDLKRAVDGNDEQRERVMTTTRWTGLAGLLAVPAALGGVMFWHPTTFVLTLVLGAVAVVGLLVAHWRFGRTPIMAALGFLLVGQFVAWANPHGSAHPVFTVGVPAAALLAAVTLACVAMLRSETVPAPAVLLILGGVAVLLGLNTILWLADAEPPYLAAGGTVAAVSGWVWANISLVVRGTRPQSAVTP